MFNEVVPIVKLTIVKTQINANYRRFNLIFASISDHLCLIDNEFYF
mgnify:CR=1 FL=1